MAPNNQTLGSQPDFGAWIFPRLFYAANSRDLYPRQKNICSDLLQFIYVAQELFQEIFVWNSGLLQR